MLTHRPCPGVILSLSPRTFGSIVAPSIPSSALQHSAAAAATGLAS